MDKRAEYIGNRDSYKPKEKNKYMLNAGGEICTSDPLAGNNRTSHRSNINQVDIESAINDHDRPSGLDVATDEAEMKEFTGTLAIFTPNIANDTGDSSSADGSVISDSEERSINDEESEINRNSPTPQSHEADRAQGDNNKRKRLDIDDEDGYSTKEKKPFEFSNTSDSASKADDCDPTPAQDPRVEIPVAAKLALSRKELLQLKRFDMVSRLLDETIAGKEGHLMLQADIVECQEMIAVMRAKYQKREESTKQKPGPKACKHPTSIDEFNKRLQGTEEEEHPWAGSLEDTPPLVMRVWDEMSQCQIRDSLTGFLSGSPSAMLNTRKTRHLALKQHSDWGNRHKTPFISTTNSLEEVVKTRVPWFQGRQKRKFIQDNTRLTLINTHVRLSAGKPVLRMKRELLYYEVRTKYGELRAYNDIFFGNEYLLPFSCAPDEIVGTWAWRDVEKWILDNNSNFKGWYDQVGMVAFEEHERIRQSGGT